MLRRLTVVTALAAVMTIAAAITLATPALAKGPSQARITGPGLAHAIVVSGNGEPGEVGRLSNLATLTGLFTVMFGPGVSPPPSQSRQVRTPPPGAALGPEYTIVYTVPGVTPRPGQQFGQIRQNLYPRAAGGPLVATPPGQHGFGDSPLPVTGWLRASPALLHALVKLGIRPPLRAPPAPQPRPGSPAALWLIVSAVAIAAVTLAGAVLWRRPRKRLAPRIAGAASREE